MIYYEYLNKSIIHFLKEFNFKAIAIEMAHPYFRYYNFDSLKAFYDFHPFRTFSISLHQTKYLSAYLSFPQKFLLDVKNSSKLDLKLFHRFSK